VGKIWLGCWMLVLALAACFSVDAASPAPSLKQIEKQFDRLEAGLKKLQQSLETVKLKELNLCQPEPTDHRPFVKSRITELISFFQGEMKLLGTGVLALWRELVSLMSRSITQEVWSDWGKIILIFMGAFVVGGVGAFLMDLCLREPARLFARWVRKFFQKHSKTQEGLLLLSDVIASFLPLGIGVLLQIVSFFLMESDLFLRSGMVSLSTGILLWWGVWKVQGIVLSAYRKSTLLRLLSGEAQKGVVFHIQGLLSFLIVGGWTDELLLFAGLSEASQRVLWILFGLGIMWSCLRLTQILRKPVLKILSKAKFHSFGPISFVWTVLWNVAPVGLYSLYIVNNSLFKKFFWLTLSTFAVLSTVPFFYQGLRCLRIRYLRSPYVRRNSTFLARLMRVNHQMKRIFWFASYGWVISCLVLLWNIHILAFIQKNLGVKLYDQLVDGFVLFGVALAVVSFGDRLLRHYLEKKPTLDSSIEAAYLGGRFRTLLTVARTLLRFGVWVPFFLLLLSIFGYDVRILLTSVGIASLGLSFGAQAFVKDFITGFFILLDNSLIVGDQVEIDGKSGTVESLSLRTLRVRADNGTLLTIPFGNIGVIGNKSRDFACALINLTVRYDADPDKVQALLEKAYQMLRRNSTFGKRLLSPIEVRGITEVSDYAVVFQARLKTAPGQQDAVKRAFNRILKTLCDEAGFPVPTPPYGSERSGTILPSLTNTLPPRV
jgi:small-conductance mechanosensitive channel